MVKNVEPQAFESKMDHQHHSFILGAPAGNSSRNLTQNQSGSGELLC